MQRSHVAQISPFTHRDFIARPISFVVYTGVIFAAIFLLLAHAIKWLTYECIRPSVQSYRLIRKMAAI